MKNYLVELDKPLDKEITACFSNENIQIIFQDDLIPDVVIVRSSITLENVDHITTYSETRKGQLLNNKCNAKVEMMPEIDATPLGGFGYGFGIKIAVLDAGVDPKLCELEDAADFTGYGKNPGLDHGSIVASIIKKYAKASQIFSAKVCHTMDDLDETCLFQGLKWAREQKVKLINMSVGIPFDCDGSCQLSRYINKISTNDGILIVAACGNKPDKKVFCPGCAEEAITVGSLNRTGDSVADTSSAGHINSTKPNLVAPGFGMISAPKWFTPFAGTSFAAPVVTGILASLVSYTGNKEILKTKLMESTSEIPGISSSKQGLGKVDLPRLLEVLGNEKQIGIAGTGD